MVTGFFAGIVGGIMVPLVIAALLINVAITKVEDAAKAAFCPPVAAATELSKLPKKIPDKLKEIVVPAAKHYNVDPLALATIFSNENGWNFDRELPPPYGNASPTPKTSSAGARGWWQFLPSTWNTYRFSNPAHQPGDINNIVDGAYAAAHMLADLGAKNGTPIGSPDKVTSKGDNIVSALTRYHSGPAFKKLGPAGRQYAQKGFEMYKSLKEAAIGVAAATTLGPVNGPLAIAGGKVVVGATKKGVGAVKKGVQSAQDACGVGQSGGSKFNGVAPDVKGYPSTAHIPCKAGRDAGTQQTAKGNVLRLCLVGGGIVVNTTVSAQVRAMIDAAAGDGVELEGGAFRSPESQIAVRKKNCGTSRYAIYEMSSSSCSPPTAKPGSSQHEQAFAIDFIRCSSRGTACYKWMNANSARFGYKNFPKEPWHWSTTGR